MGDTLSTRVSEKEGEGLPHAPADNFFCQNITNDVGYSFLWLRAIIA
jgi:hypothetical protein